MCLVTMAYVYAACAVCVTNFSTGGKLWLVSNIMELHACTVAARSDVLSAATTKWGYFNTEKFWYTW